MCSAKSLEKTINYLPFRESYLLEKSLFLQNLSNRNFDPQVSKNIICKRFAVRNTKHYIQKHHRDWSPKFATGLKCLNSIDQKVYKSSKWPFSPFAKRIPPWVNHFCKRTECSLIYFLIYAYLNILAQSQILVISLYVSKRFAVRNTKNLANTPNLHKNSVCFKWFEWFYSF